MPGITRFTVLLLLVTVVLSCTALHAKVTVHRITYRGWNDSYTLDAGRFTLVVVPDIGGRIMEYAVDRRSVIWENPSEVGRTYPITSAWHNYGGYKAWVAPQHLWDGNADPFLDYGKASAEILSRPDGIPMLRITSAPSLKTGLVLTKEISMDESGEVLLVQKMHNISSERITRSIWDVTQVRTPCFVVYPVKHDSRFRNGASYLMEESKRSPQFRVVDGFCITEYMGELGKVGSDSDGPWMIWFKDKLAYVKFFDPMVKRAEYPDEGCSAEVFTSDKKLAYLEMEILGPMVTLKPGESTELVERWRLFELTQSVTNDDRVLKAIGGMRGRGWIE